MNHLVVLLFLFSSVRYSSQLRLLTWYINPGSGYDVLTERAFDFWEQSSTYDFLRVFNPNYADIRVHLMNATAMNYSERHDGHANPDTRELFLYIDRLSTPQRFFTVAAHEIGHVLYLEHHKNNKSIMYFSARTIPLHRRLHLIDQLALKRLHSQCGPIDSIALLNREPFVIFKGIRRYQRHGRYGSKWDFVADHFGINITKVDALFQFPNGTFALISNNVLWNNLYTDYVFKNDVGTALNITSKIKTAGNVRDGVLFITFDNQTLLYSNDTTRNITMYPFPNNAIGVFDNLLPGIAVIRDDTSIWNYKSTVDSVFFRIFDTDFGLKKWFPQC